MQSRMGSVAVMKLEDVSCELSHEAGDRPCDDGSSRPG